VASETAVVLLYWEQHRLLAFPKHGGPQKGSVPHAGSTGLSALSSKFDAACAPSDNQPTIGIEGVGNRRLQFRLSMEGPPTIAFATSSRQSRKFIFASCNHQCPLSALSNCETSRPAGQAVRSFPWSPPICLFGCQIICPKNRPASNRNNL